MTSITIKKKSIFVYGHSNYGVKGGDIVCSAISTLVGMYGLRHEKYTKECELTPYIIIKRNNLSLKSRNDFTFVKDGLIEISKLYPENVEVEIVQ